ncbi:MAG TPA: hypothetical protein ENO08_02785 [Candidatus Eisenbacteria bacterium]|uniref:Uncharacterized protein n=1 Tax=Eiseniibacteriota bacterium TaxID=2212470 RepID=A0A7V2F3E5_UNCEI|nr:hypothetical protein [Candidatus Eisenbacteria bacterium]
MHPLLDETPERELIARAENLITRLRDVQSCRITTDETGQIAEIHVVACTDRPAKLIARDVETCLRAELGLYFDYRKIGVVLIDTQKDLSEKEPAAPRRRWTDRLDVVDRREEDQEESIHDLKAEDEIVEAEPGLEFLEADMRARFKGLTLTLEEDTMDVEVRLERSGIEASGSMTAVAAGEPMLEVIGRATVHALAELLDEGFTLRLARIEEIDLKGRTALLAMIEVVAGREARSYVGCVFVGRDRHEAAALAVLDAVNRPLGRWKSRKEIHYTIR